MSRILSIAFATIIAGCGEAPLDTTEPSKEPSGEPSGETTSDADGDGVLMRRWRL